jgi:hypothetical protein
MTLIQFTSNPYNLESFSEKKKNKRRRKIGVIRKTDEATSTAR